MIRALPVLGAVLLACAPHRVASPQPPPLAGVPLSVNVAGLDGAVVRLGGPGAVRVVDLFASWCEPCRAQLPALQRLAEAHAGGDLAVAAVSLDEDRAALDRFLAQVPLAIPILWDRGGAAVTPALQIQRLPTTLVVDRGGVIRHVHLGYDGRASDERLEQEVLGLLAER
jgi:cytochrome c biogenesis protein CcmG, thiol:disulfide interchange protein DsbE